MKTNAAASANKSTPPPFEVIYNNLKDAIAHHDKRDHEITSQIEALTKETAAKIEALTKEQERVRAENARAKSGLEAMSGGTQKPNGKSTKPGPKKTVAKKAAKKVAKAAAKKAAKAAPKTAAKAATKQAAPKAAPAAKKAAKAAAKAPAVKKAPAAKKAAAKKASPAAKKAAAGKANTSNAAEGRRAVARGDRPPMREAMAQVMGKATMGAADVVAGLEKKGWMPNAEDPQQYVSYMLSSNKETFERVERGSYKVRSGVVFSKPKAKKGTGDTAPVADKKASASAKKSTEEELSDLGVKTGGSVSSNPFANQEQP